MAFNWQTFRTRALTAVVFVVVMLGGLFWNQWSFLVLFSIIHFGCWWEYLRLMEKIHKVVFHPYVKLGFMVIGYGLMLWFCRHYHVNGYGLRENISLPVSAAGFVLLVTGIFQRVKVELKSFGAAAIGLFYISLSWGLMIDLSNPYFNPYVLYYAAPSYRIEIPFLVIASIWINDTMAYIVGSLIGKTPFSKISPKKTWEGTVGGMILCVGVIFLFKYIATGYKDEDVITYTVVAAISAIVGTLGDLLESKLKRMADVKDSGHIMPGHGGFLDRFDSLLLAIPAVWLYLFISIGI